MEERCDVCRGTIRRSERDDAVYWFGPSRGTGMAWLSTAHAACYPKVTADMHASPRERALTVANMLGRARAERSEESKAAMMILAVGMGDDEDHRMFEMFQEIVETEDDDEFRERSSSTCSRWPDSRCTTACPTARRFYGVKGSTRRTASSSRGNSGKREPRRPNVASGALAISAGHRRVGAGI
jgi:hypothetical protein